MREKSFYITTTLPYVNADPHLGHAMELVHADVIARYKVSRGYDVFFNTGTDEHGQKVYKASEEAGLPPQEYTDKFAKRFLALQETLGLSQGLHFIRTTNAEHKKAAQEFWKLCDEAGDIYKKNYEVKYCEGCELEKTDSELENGRCPIHPNKDIEIREEENYFFRFSKYGERLIEIYDKDPDFMIPDFRLNEMRALIDRGLEDFSISRLKEKMPWGVEVSGDSQHVMYVWFDALVNYVSTLGWPSDTKSFERFWEDGTPVQMAGKDQVRQQAAMWQAMLLSAGLPPTRHIVIHGFINYEGQKMSKSLGNVVDPFELLSEYSVDVLRYFLLREINQFEDSDISRDRLRESYNANLANGLGNLVARIMRLAEDHLDTPVEISEDVNDEYVSRELDRFNIHKSINYIWEEIGKLDLLIQESKPWESKDQEAISSLVSKLGEIARTLAPFMPETSQLILEAISKNKMPDTLFPRK